jgi:predicted SnoaL-like aldol condensation-catalyzing enzyme
MVLPARAHVNSPRGTAGGGAKAGLLSPGFEALALRRTQTTEDFMRPTAFAVPAATLVLLAASPLPMARGHETNKKTVLELFEAGINQKDFAKASQYFGPRHTQHNPNAADGPEGFHKFVDFLREKFPNSHSKIKQVFTDGDYVILHVHAVREPGTRGNAIVDIFKLENGKVVEHCDVIQPIPKQAANSNRMF